MIRNIPSERPKKVNTGKQNRKKSARLLLAGMLAAVLAFSLPLRAYAENIDETMALQQAKPIETNEIPGWPTGPVISADSAILMDAETGAVLYAKDIHAREYPASTTKILTALIAAENCRMDEIVSFSYNAVHDVTPGGSHIAIDAGEELTMEQCLGAILIASANEVSFAVAEHITGTSWQDFASVMNARARELGCTDSNFVNPNGLHDEEHYTSAHDLAMIGRSFFANELLCRFASTTRLHIPPTDKQPDDIYAATTNEMLPGRLYPYPYLVGGKTGYTDPARSCLVSCAEKDGLRLICVVMHDYAPRQYQDTAALFDYGFANFQRVNISQAETKYNIDNSNFFYSDNDIFGSSRPILSLNAQDCVTLPKTASFSEAASEISYDQAGEGQVAVIRYTYNGQFIGAASVDLIADAGVSYSFDRELAKQMPPPLTEDEEKKNVIFVNVVKVALWILGIAGGFIVLTVLYAFIRNYQFARGGRRPENRRGWRRRRRKRRRW